MDVTPILVEQRNGSFGEYTEIWLAEPPHIGVNYRVIEQSWNDDFTQRTIRKVEIVTP